MTLDIVFGIGCPVQCTRYCPQEVIVKKHQMGPLTLDNFKRYVSTIPNDELLIFAGISEPFCYKDAVEIILYAYEKGHPINLFTTLRGLKPDDAKRLVKIPFNTVVLHLPDAEGNAKIPPTPEYFECLYTFLTNVKNLQCMNMGKNFVSDHNEDVIRGKVGVRLNGRVMCPNLGTRAYMLFPDGMVTLCCMLRGMEGVVGNLNDNTYPELMDRFESISKEYQTDPKTMCHKCSVSENYWWYHAKKPLSGFIRRPGIIRLRNKLKVFPVTVQLGADESLQRPI
jgi:hypothetical protein